jgi:hypothetical protein
VTPDEIRERYTALPDPDRLAFDRITDRWRWSHDDYTRHRTGETSHGTVHDQMFQSGAMYGLEWALYAVLGLDPATEMPIYDEDPLRTYLELCASDRSDRGSDV